MYSINSSDDKSLKTFNEKMPKFYWHNGDIEDDGVPFSIERRIAKSCQYGKPHKAEGNDNLQVGNKLFIITVLCN